MFTFFDPDLDPESFLTGDKAKPLSFNLNAEESFHGIQVLRLTKGTPIHIINGKGSRFLAEIFLPSPKSCGVILLDHEFIIPRPYSLNLAIAPPKSMDRFEWFLEKATEIGIDQISPIITQNSERRNLNPERLNKLLVSAIKQSGQAYFPVLNKLETLSEFQKIKRTGSLMMAHCRETNKKPFPEEVIQSNDKDFTILIGPEGDFTEAEIKGLIENSFLPISLGNSRLRTETAAILVCAQLALLKGQNL